MFRVSNLGQLYVSDDKETKNQSVLKNEETQEPIVTNTEYSLKDEHFNRICDAINQIRLYNPELEAEWQANKEAQNQFFLQHRKNKEKELLKDFQKKVEAVITLPETRKAFERVKEAIANALIGINNSPDVFVNNDALIDVPSNILEMLKLTDEEDSFFRQYKSGVGLKELAEQSGRRVESAANVLKKSIRKKIAIRDGDLGMIIWATTPSVFKLLTDGILSLEQFRNHTPSELVKIVKRKKEQNKRGKTLSVTIFESIAPFIASNLQIDCSKIIEAANQRGKITIRSEGRVGANSFCRFQEMFPEEFFQEKTK